MALIGVVGLMFMTPTTPQWVLTINLLVLGLGLGPAQGMFTLAIQSAVTHARVGVATASAQFCRQIGATVGVAIFGALLTYNLTRELPNRVPELVTASQPLELAQAQTLVMDKTALQRAMAAQNNDDPAVVAKVEAGLKDSFAVAIETLFPVTLVMLLLAWLVTLRVPRVTLRGREPPPGRDPQAVAAAAM